jgi:hypothetical protein
MRDTNVGVVIERQCNRDREFANDELGLDTNAGTVSQRKQSARSDARLKPVRYAVGADSIYVIGELPAELFKALPTPTR